MNIIIQKYGGSSVADANKIKNVANRIKKRVLQNYKLVVIVSAPGKTTDQLIKFAKEVSSNPEPREMDMLLATGEQMSVALLSMALKEINIKAKSFNAFQLNIQTTEHHTKARIKDIDEKIILKNLQEYDVIVVAGFQGINQHSDITTLGRGGSDTTAVAIAAKLKAPCEIYSDVDGIYTCDPRIHPNAKKHSYITYDDVLELASLGAKVLHSRAVELAKKYNITLLCASSFNESEGTMVVNNLPEWLEEPVVTGATITKNELKVTLLNLPKDQSIISKIFDEVSEKNLNVDMISIVSSNDKMFLSFSILEEQREDFEKVVQKALDDLKEWNLSYNGNFSKLSIVGIGMKTAPGVATRFFKALSKINIIPELVTTSEIKISALVPREKAEQALKEIITEFGL